VRSRSRQIWFALVSATLLLSSGAYIAAWAYLEKHPGAFGSAFEIQDLAPLEDWHSVSNKHWQLLTEENEPGLVLEPLEANPRGACPEGMVEIRGNAKVNPRNVAFGSDIEALQDRACTAWISKEFPARCASFDREKWLSLSREFPTVEKHYCIDRYEYPNRKGQNPIVVVTWNEAKALCENDHKRLCTEDEWTFACEGEEATPYPNGYERDVTACVIDRPWRPFSQAAMIPRDGESARAEMDRLWQGEPSGSRPACRSSFGVYDLTGNVDEWTQSTQGAGYASVLKGGYWGPVRARCRPATRAHDETFIAYQQGFRCCAEASDREPIASDAGDNGADLSDASTPEAGMLDAGNPPPPFADLPEEDRAIAKGFHPPVFSCAPLFGRFVGAKPTVGASIGFLILGWRRKRPNRASARSHSRPATETKPSPR